MCNINLLNLLWVLWVQFGRSTDPDQYASRGFPGAGQRRTGSAAFRRLSLNGSTRACMRLFQGAHHRPRARRVWCAGGYFGGHVNCYMVVYPMSYVLYRSVVAHSLALFSISPLSVSRRVFRVARRSPVAQPPVTLPLLSVPLSIPHSADDCHLHRLLVSGSGPPGVSPFGICMSVGDGAPLSGCLRHCEAVACDVRSHCSARGPVR